MEDQKATIEIDPVQETGDRRASRLIASVPSTDAFAGWGPRMAGSLRDILRGMN